MEIVGEYPGIDTDKGIYTYDLEMTFYFDQIFGDAGVPDDDELNTPIGLPPMPYPQDIKNPSGQTVGSTLSLHIFWLPLSFFKSTACG